MGKRGKDLWTLLVAEGEEESLGDEGSTKLVESFSLGSSSSECDSKGERSEDSVGTPSVASPNWLDELVSREEEEE